MMGQVERNIDLVYGGGSIGKPKIIRQRAQMAETPADQSPARTQTEARSGSGHQSSQYWCYSCDKRVAVETLADLPDVVCFECKNGFVEAISLPSAAAAIDPLDDPNFGSQFLQVLRIIAQAAREEDAPPPLPSDPSNDDYLQIELDEWDNDDAEEEDGEEEEEGEGEDEDDDEHSVEVVGEEEENREREAENNRSGEDEEEDEIPRGPRTRRYEFLRRHLTEFASRAASRRNRIFDWADVLVGLDVDLTLQDTYVGNPGDYVDASEYEALLQNLAESDNARRGAPPAAKAAVEALGSVEIDEEVVCAICKDSVNVGEIAKSLPCAHLYHGECIVPWLGSRNTCPVCRFELPTDDPEYEEERKKKAGASTASSASAGDDHAAPSE